jgi:hypothetical protein
VVFDTICTCRSRLPYRESDALLKRISSTFVDLLAETDTKEAIEAAEQLVTQLESHSGVIHNTILDCLNRHNDRLNSTVETHVNRIKLLNQRVDQVRATNVDHLAASAPPECTGFSLF